MNTDGHRGPQRAPIAGTLCVHLWPSVFMIASGAQRLLVHGEGLASAARPGELRGACGTGGAQASGEILIRQHARDRVGPRVRVHRIDEQAASPAASGSAPASAATTGVPHAIPSSSARPKPSSRDGTTTPAAAA